MGAARIACPPIFFRPKPPLPRLEQEVRHELPQGGWVVAFERHLKGQSDTEFHNRSFRELNSGKLTAANSGLSSEITPLSKHRPALKPQHVQFSLLTLVVARFSFDLSVHISCTRRLLTN
jgi:hypothetical protein